MPDVLEEILDGFDAVMQRIKDEPWILPTGYPVAQSLDCVMQGKPDPKTMSASFTIVTRNKGVNRQGNKLRIAGDSQFQGLSLDNYKTNPVVFLDHGQRGLTLPIGVSEGPDGQNTVKLFQGKADATCYFSQRLPEAVQVYALCDEGILRTASISFMPLKAMSLPQKDRTPQKTEQGDEVYDISPGRWGMDFVASDMLEWSIVGIPADAGAVRKFLDVGKIGTEKITQSMKGAMQQMAGAPPIWSGWTPQTSTWMNEQADEKTMLRQLLSRVDEFRGAFEQLAAGQQELAANLGVVQSQVEALTPTKVDDQPAESTTEPQSQSALELLTATLKQELTMAIEPFAAKQQQLETAIKQAAGR